MATTLPASLITETTDISTVSAVTVWKTTQTISDITSEIHSSLEATTLAENSTHLLNIPSLNTNSATTESYDTTLLTKNQSSSTNQLLSTTEAGSTIPENPSTIIVSNTNSLSSTNPSSSGSTNPTSTSSTNPNSTMATNPDTSLEGCQCPCSRAASLNNTEELNTRIKKLRKELEVNIVKLSSFIRTKTSAPDNRISSVFIGSVFGVFFITSAILLIVLSDLTLLIRQIRYGP
ncbi:uncharacterized protein LOC133193566 [Saccostrea echinata]|uniref:uncharacterized protein LOC133193566 n=1 Tax=Saccostrea echinata TaxID=191078 RepID=UPI002A80B1D5|nr:uncharacterized protein LOC133193566 [Saccostrea echinata]